MRHFSCTLVVIVFLLLQIIGVAQTYSFNNVTVANGLSQEQVLALFQDKEGVVWIGTSGGGIVQNNGKVFSYLKDKQGLADNIVYCIEQDQNGRILIGTNNGLSIYDTKAPNAKRFKNYTVKNGLSHNRIFTIYKTSTGQVVLGTGNGLSVFKDSVCLALITNSRIDSSAVFNIMEDVQHTLWLSTLGNGVFSYTQGSIKNYNENDGLGNNMVFSVFEYKPNEYWVCTGEGLFELKNQHLKRINFSQITDTSTTYYSCFKDYFNTLWIATGKGVIKWEQGKTAKLFNTKNGLVDNNIWKIFQDSEKNMWFASYENGVSMLARENFSQLTIKDGLLTNEIKALHQSKNGQLWIGSKLGVTKYNPKGTSQYFTEKEFLGNSDVWDITSDASNNLFIGTGNGLLIYDGNKIKRLNAHAGSENLNGVYDVFIDRKGVVWLGTQGGVATVENGKISLLPATKSIKSFVWTIFEDNSGNYWFGTDEGLYRFDGKHLTHFTEKEGIIQKPIYSIVSDKQGALWFASTNGIYRYYQNAFSLINEQQGLAANIVYSLVLDSKGFLWAGLPNGLDKIDYKNGSYKIKHYDVDNGFLGQKCGQNAFLVDTAGRLLIGTSKGLITYYPEYDRDNLSEPKTQISRIDLFNQPTDWKLYADSVNENNIPYSLILPFDKNYLRFTFIGVSLTTPNKVSYQYMLKGLDTDWHYGNNTEIPYDNLPPGEYEFLVKANNGEGVWNKESVSFKFTITPPFWQTWWFYSIIASIVLIGIYSYIKIRNANKQILSQNEVIEEKNLALQFANQKIAEKNQSITDSINYAKRIQESFLTTQQTLDKGLKEHFILYKPRDIVSGDFYWVFDLSDRTLIVCADCTGHGIPGAFMSLIGISLLNEISHSKGIIEPAKILDELRRIIICALNPEQMEEGGKDGMDISLLSVFKSAQDSTEVKIHFTGANSSMYIVPLNEKNIIEIKGDKQPVGFYSSMTPFSQKEVIVKRGDILYLFTDGYSDQFGGSKGKKFMSKQLKQELVGVAHLSLQEQKKYLETILSQWQGNLEQVDDITVLGMRL